jgi:hypothetical protein
VKSLPFVGAASRATFLRPEAVCELLDSFDTPATRLEKQMSHDLATSRRSPDRSWVAVLVLITLLLAPAALTTVATYTVNQRNQPSDEELTTNLLSHEAKFDELVEMLDSDCRSLPPGAGESIDLARLSAVVTSAARMAIYKGLLRQISVADLRCFPGSGKVILLPAAQTNIEGFSKSYAYMVGDQPQPVVAHHGYNWRGPGIYFLTGDRRVKGLWFIHYDTMIALAFSPY